MSSPTQAIRAAVQTLFDGNLTFDSGKAVTYLDRDPGQRPKFPYVRISNIFNLPENYKNCLGWRPLLRLQTFTGASPGHNTPEYSDEIETQIIDLMSAKPYQLDLGAGYGVVSCNLEASTELEEYTNLAIGKSAAKPYHIIRKITDFRIEIQEL